MANAFPLDSSAPGRIYLAVATTNGAYTGSYGYWIGRPCARCAPATTGHVQTAPCRAPLTHATETLRRWRTGNPDPGRYLLLAPHADTLREAQAAAVHAAAVLARPARRTQQHG